MKASKLLLIIFVFALFTVFPHRVSALVPSITKTDDLKPSVTQKRIETKQRKEDMKASKSAELTELRKNKIRAFWKKLMNVMNAHITRQEKLITRLETRINQIAANNEGVDTADAKKTLADAKTKLNTAKTELNNANGSIETVLTSSKPKEAFATVLKTLKKVRDIIKEVHVMLAHTIGDLKGLRVSTNKLSETPKLTPTTAVTPTLTPTPTI